MKKLLFILLAMLAVSSVAKTNYVVKGNKVVAVADTTAKSSKPIIIGTYTNTKGVTFNVYRGVRGGVYYINQNGKRCSLPKEVKATFEAIARKIK